MSVPAVRPLLVPFLVGLAVLAVMAGAVWSVTSGASALPQAGPGEVALPGGLARVDQVVSAARPMNAMPGMGEDEDPVAADERRVSVEVTLLATEGETLGYDVDAFTLEVPGAAEPRQPHRSVLPGSEMPAGTQLSGTLIFDVPVDTTSAVLGYEGGGTTDVELPSETPATPLPGGATVPDAPPPGAMTHPDDHGTQQGAVDTTEGDGAPDAHDPEGTP